MALLLKGGVNNHIDARKLGMAGNQLAGQQIAMTRWVHILEVTIAKTKDNSEKKVCEELLQVARKELDDIQRMLSQVAASDGALTRISGVV